MNISYFEIPFQHIIVENVFLEEELKKVDLSFEFINLVLNSYSEEDNKSIQFNISNDYSLSLKDTVDNNKSSASNNGYKLSKRESVFIEDVISNPLKNFFPLKNIEHILKNIIKDKSLLAQILKNSYRTGFLLSNFRHGDFYEPHADNSFVTGIYYKIDHDTNFEGGELVFKERNKFTFKPKNNSMIFFPSNELHQVVELKSTNPKSNKILRTALTLFFGSIQNNE